ncbi:anti-sigma factor, partial [Metabacillus niabensis]
MTCRKQNRILMFDQLTESEQNQLLDHIETCAKCETYFDQYLLLEEGLDVLLMDEAIPLSANKKKSIPAILRPALLACASMFFIFLLIWNNDSVRAVIESTINEVIVEYLIKNMEPLEPENETSKTEKITYA